MPAEDLQKHLKALDELCSKISFALKEEEVFAQILRKSCEILNTDGMSILLRTPGSDVLSFYAVAGSSKEEIIELGNIPLKEGIAGWVYNTGKSVFLNDPYSHPKFLSEVDSKTGFKTKNIICVPLISRMRQMGVLEIVNKKSGNFIQEDLYFAQALAGIVSIVLRNIGLFTELTNQRNLMKAILDNIPGGFIAIDEEGKIVEFNRAAGRILGFGISVVNANVKDSLKMQEEITEVLFKTYKEGKTGNRLILNTLKSNGEKLILGYGTILIKTEEGRVIGSGIIFQDLTKIQGLP